MKTYKISVILIFAIFLSSSCSDDFLELSNPNTFTVADFWKTEKDATLAINATYGGFYRNGSWSRWMYYRFDLSSDECSNVSPWVELQDWTKFKYFNYNFMEGNWELWADHYKAIFRSNQVLKNVPDIEFSSEELKNRILGEAKFLRSLNYYDLALLWGNVPLIEEPSNPDDLPPTTSQDEILDFIEKDLREAMEMLPENYSGDEKGRATKGAAKALLARALMLRHKWAEAKEQLNWLVTGAGSQYYGLVQNWEDNFTHYNENNEESVFEIQFSEANQGGWYEDVPGRGVGSHRAQFFAPNGIGWNEADVRGWVVDEFLKEKRIDGQYDRRLLRTAWFYEQDDYFPNDDNSIYGWKNPDGSRHWSAAWDFESTNTGETGHRNLLRKYQNDYWRNYENYHGPINYRFIRYADVLLMLAECINNLEGPSNAVQYVNMVRARVNMPNLDVNYPEALQSKENFQARLEMERTLELCGESVRWADLMRWGYFDSNSKIDVLKSRDLDFSSFSVGKHKFLPIPQLEMDANPNLTQNNGY